MVPAPAGSLGVFMSAADSWEVKLFGRGADGRLPAGRAREKVIPDDALLRLNVGTFNDAVRQRVLGAMRRILDAQATGPARPSCRTSRC